MKGGMVKKKEKGVGGRMEIKTRWERMEWKEMVEEDVGVNGGWWRRMKRPVGKGGGGEGWRGQWGKGVGEKDGGVSGERGWWRKIEGSVERGGGGEGWRGQWEEGVGEKDGGVSGKRGWGRRMEGSVGKGGGGER